MKYIFNQKSFIIKRLLPQLETCDYDMLVAIERFIKEMNTKKQSRQIAQDE